MNMKEKMDIISLIFSIVSLLGSVISFIITLFQNHKLNSFILLQKSHRQETI